MLLEERSPERLELSIELGYVLLEDGEFADVARGDRRGRRRRRADRATERSAVTPTWPADSHTLYGSEERRTRRRSSTDTQQAIESFEVEGDAPRAQSKAWALLAALHGTAGRYEELRPPAPGPRRRARARRQRVRVSGAIGYAVSSLHGPTPVDEAMREYESLTRDVAGDRRAEAMLLGDQAVLNALMGDFTAARDQAARGTAMLVELGTSVFA